MQFLMTIARTAVLAAVATFLLFTLTTAGTKADIIVSSPAFDPVVASLTAILTASPSKKATWIRLAWHSSGTYDATRNPATEYRYGSMGGTLRFPSEQAHGANAGLAAVVTELEAIHQQFPWMSYGDLYTLAGSLGITTAVGPNITWTHGRCDAPDSSFVPPSGYLPDAVKQGDSAPNWPQTMGNISIIFTRMGFNAQETVALIGAHCMGRAKSINSGFNGPWTLTPNTFTNKFFSELSNKIWTLTTSPAGQDQYENGTLMMLPSDFGILTYNPFLTAMTTYRDSEQQFFADFQVAWEKLINLGMSDPFAKTAFAAGCTTLPTAMTTTTTAADASSGGAALASSIMGSAIASACYCSYLFL